MGMEMRTVASRILVAYATRYGSTREVAEAAATALRDLGIDVDAKLAKDVSTLGGCGGVVLATPFYMGSMLKDATQFLERNRTALQGLPVALLACGPLRVDDDPAEARGQLDGALAKVGWLTPVAAEMFVGKYDPARLRLADKLIAVLPASPLHGMGVHDGRDWASIRAWTETLPRAMGLA
jgi:menaquinone-dependent protoporphyrinogen oxidase